jgi:hypothetical protein
MTVTWNRLMVSGYSLLVTGIGLLVLAVVR